MPLEGTEATTDSIGSRRVDTSRLRTQSENSDGRMEDEKEEHEEEDEEEDIPKFRVRWRAGGGGG